jgi:hypothetical protein
LRDGVLETRIPIFHVFGGGCAPASAAQPITVVIIAVSLKMFFIAFPTISDFG